MIKTQKSVQTSAKGYYALSVKKADGTEVLEKCSKTPTQNVVTYAGAYRCLQVGLYRAYSAVVGTGSTELTRTSTDLNNLIIGKIGSGAVVSRADGVETDNGDGTSTITIERTLSFPLGDIVGTISEVGVKDSAILIAGQLIKDEFGNPTTVTILADEQLIVTYTLQWVVPTTSKLIGSGSVTVDGSPVSYEIYAQPYFRDYALNAASAGVRYTAETGSDEITLLDATGSTHVANSGFTGDTWDITHNGVGTATFTSQLISFSPSSIAFSGMTFLGLYTYDGDYFANNLVDTVAPLAQSSSASYNAVYIKFASPISKDNTQAFEFQIEFTLTI